MKKALFIFILQIILLTSCSKSENKTTKNIESVESKKTEIITTEKEENFEIQKEEIPTVLYEINQEKDKNGVIEISKIMENFNIQLEYDYQILPECEILSKPLINKENNLIYDYNPKNPVYPEGPVSIQNGTLYFTQENKVNFKYSNLKWEPLEIGSEIPQEEDYSKFLPEHFSKDASTFYLVKDGIIFEDYRNQEFIGIDIEDTNNPQIIHAQDLNNWDNFTKEGFSYTHKGPDGNPALLKNEVLWSIGMAYYSALNFDSTLKFSGKMFTGHNIFSNSQFYMIIDNSGEILRQILIPWRMKTSSKVLYLCKMSWKLGKYGEIYALLGPEKDSLETSENAELVVIRNYFSKFGVVDVNKLVLFEEPNDDSTVINFYPENTGFYFIENEITESNKIDNETWYKVRILDGTEGYFKGVNIKALNDVPKSSFPWK